MLLAWLIIATLLYSLSLALWFGFFGLSFMAFDSGFSIGGALFVAAIGLYAPTALGGMIWSWISYRKKEVRRAGLLTLIPLGYIALLLLILQIGIWINA